MSLQNDFLPLCQHVGRQVPIWTQGPGGNISVKEASDGKAALWIKASGSRLDGVTERSGLSRVSLEQFLARLQIERHGDHEPEASYMRALLAAADPNLGRPSMETGFHALLPRRLVAHFHSLAAVLMAHHATHEPQRLQTWLSRHSELVFEFVEAVRPGWALAERLAARPEADIYVLTNHGVVLQGDTVGLLDVWRTVERDFCAAFGYTLLGTLLEDRAPLVSARAMSRAAPWRVYFPDSAVFFDRVQAILAATPAAGLETGERLWSLKPEAWHQDADAAELWLATQLLYDACPSLDELPRPLADSIVALPAEAWRRQAGESTHG